MLVKFKNNLSTLKVENCKAKVLEENELTYLVEITETTNNTKIKVGTKLLTNKLNCIIL